MSYETQADAVLLVHAGYIVFVVLGLLLIVVGGALGWRWVRQRWFRLVHLAAIGLVVLQAWLGIVCPLTTLENHLRRQAGQSGYELGFIADRVQRVVFYEAPSWVFVVLYSAFGVLVLTSFWLVRPDWRPRSSREGCEAGSDT
jgi:polyferredoxin